MTPHGARRKFAAILSADVVDNTWLMGNGEVGKPTQLKAPHLEPITPKIAATGGCIITFVDEFELVPPLVMVCANFDSQQPPGHSD